MEDTGDLVFSLRGVSKRRPGHEGFHLRLAAFDAPRGSLLALAGPSGCGKSTALDLLACILRPDIPAAGAERDNTRFSFAPTPERREDVLAAWRRGGTDALAALRLRHLGYVLQTGGLLPFVSARENILLHCRSLGIVRQREEAVDAIVERLGIRHLLGQYPGTLSVGERQRVAIARASGPRPRRGAGRRTHRRPGPLARPQCAASVYGSDAGTGHYHDHGYARPGHGGGCWLHPGPFCRGIRSRRRCGRCAP